MEMADSYDAVVIGGGVIGTATLFNLAGVACGLLDRVEALARHPWLKLDGIDAIGFEAEAGFADPYLVTTGFARAARRLGAEIRTATSVTGLLRDRDRVVGVQTAAGPIHTDIVLSAVNVW